MTNGHHNRYCHLMAVDGAFFGFKLTKQTLIYDFIPLN